MSADDPYVYPGTDVLRNKYDLRNDRSLGRRERIESSLALKQLGQSPVTGAFDLKHYQDIHRRLFEKVYDWAGQIRTVDLTKPEIALQGQTVQYSPVARIEADATRAVALMAGDWGDLKNRPEAARFAVVVAELWRAHPFREGNTRTVLAFVEQFARARDISLDMAVINRVPSETRDALALATTGHVAPLVRLIVEARRSELQRPHPELGRLSSEAAEVVRLLGNPRIVVPVIGEAFKAQVLTTSYDQVLMRRGAEIAAVPLRAFAAPPRNDARITLTVPAPGAALIPVPAPSQVPQRAPDTIRAERPAALIPEVPAAVPLDAPAPAPQREPDTILAERPAALPLDTPAPTPAPRRVPEALIPPKIPLPVPPEMIDAYLAGDHGARQARSEALASSASVFKAPDALVQTFERQIVRGARFDPAAFASEPLRGRVTWRGEDRERKVAVRHLPAAIDALRRLEGALRAAMATQRTDLDRRAQRDHVAIPAPSPALADALAVAVASGSVRAVLANPELMAEVKELTNALHARFEHEGTAVLAIGRPIEAAALLPEGQTVEAVRAVLEPLRAVVLAEQEQARTLTQDKTLAPEAPDLGASR